MLSTATRSGLPKFSPLILLLVLLALPAWAADRVETVATSLEEVLVGFDRTQDGIQSLRADFTELTVNELLKEPSKARGRFYLTKPDAVMWEYTAPERMRFVIAQDEYVGYFPKRKTAEKRNIKRWSERIFRFFGLGQASMELKQTYDIRLAAADSKDASTHLLILEPKRKRVKRHMDEVRFWVDRSSYLPVRVEYRDPSGNRRIIDFDRVELNPDLEASVYSVDLPSDVTVTTGFSGLGASR